MMNQSKAWWQSDGSIRDLELDLSDREPSLGWTVDGFMERADVRET